MADPYIIPRRLDDPELIGFWTIDEFAGMLAPFTWGILTQHIFIGIIVALPLSQRRRYLLYRHRPTDRRQAVMTRGDVRPSPILCPQAVIRRAA